MSHLCAGAGLMGGHSGLNIAEDRGNAVQFVARLANAVLKAAPESRLARIAGGDKRNAIAREATVDLVVGAACFPIRQPPRWREMIASDTSLHMHGRHRHTCAVYPLLKHNPHSVCSALSCDIAKWSI